MKANVMDGGCALNLKDLEAKECIVAAFPLHNFTELKALKEKWFSWKFAPWGQPVEQIKDYFGEKVGLYFAWLGAWLVCMAGRRCTYLPVGQSCVSLAATPTVANCRCS